MKFTVIGGGICGLTTAIALIRSGHEVLLFEAASELREAGAGVVLGCNAMRALHGLGVHDAVKAAGSEVTTMNLSDATGVSISEMDTLRVTRASGFSNLAIHRADLQRILLEHLPEGVVRLGSLFERFEQDGEQVTACFAGDRTVRADGLLAADGIRSRARLQIFPQSVPRFAGYTCWRGVADASSLGLPPGRSFEFWGGVHRFGYVPLTRGQAYWYACINSRTPGHPTYKNWGIADLEAQFARYPSPVPELLAQTPENRLLWNDILDVKPVKQFAHGRILLLGDAAHATTPNLGQGAGQAVEDAEMLAQCLKETDGLCQSFVEFDRRRRPRTTKIVNMSWQVGKMAHLRSPWLNSLRNMAMRGIPRRVRERQIDFLHRG